MKALLKKHYDKITLAAALLILISSAALLSFKIGTLSQEVQQAPNGPRGQVKAVEPMELRPYSNAIAALKQPPLWTNGSDIFPKNPGPIIVTNAPPPPPVGDIPVLAQVLRQPFKLLLMAYSGEGENFQINFLTRARTFVVTAVGDQIKDQFGDTGYVIKKFERKTILVQDPTVGGQREEDVSELTIQHEGEEPILLVLGRITEEKEPVAVILCRGNPQPQQVSRQQQFGCGNKTYIVVDITERQMIIVDSQSGERHTISLGGPKE
jgi:hypothetical protein